MDVIKPATTQCKSQLVFVPKKDGYLKVFVDHRKLSAVTTRYGYKIPRMDE